MEHEMATPMWARPRLRRGVSDLLWNDANAAVAFIFDRRYRLFRYRLLDAVRRGTKGEVMNYTNKAIILQFAGVDWEPRRKCHKMNCGHLESRHSSVGFAARVPHDIPPPPLNAEVFEKCLERMLTDAGESWRGAFAHKLFRFPEPPRDAVFTTVLALHEQEQKK